MSGGSEELTSDDLRELGRLLGEIRARNQARKLSHGMTAWERGDAPRLSRQQSEQWIDDVDCLLAALDRREGEVARLKALLGKVAWDRTPGLPAVPVLQDRYDAVCARRAEMDQENATLRALLERAAAALGPFAAVVQRYGHWPDSMRTSFSAELSLLGQGPTLGHCRHAAAALAAIGEALKAPRAAGPGA